VSFGGDSSLTRNSGKTFPGGSYKYFMKLARHGAPTQSLDVVKDDADFRGQTAMTKVIRQRSTFEDF
jgi:hypothetical protein